MVARAKTVPGTVSPASTHFDPQAERVYLKAIAALMQRFH
jgi:hypothetical protein